MRSPVLAFSLLAAATLISAAGNLSGPDSLVEAPAGQSLQDHRLVDTFAANPQGENLALRDIEPEPADRPDPRTGSDRLPPPRPQRQTPPQGSNTYADTCSSSSSDGSDALGVNGLSGGTSCTGNAVGESADGSTPSYTSELDIPGAAIGNVTNVVDTPTDKQTSSYSLQESPMSQYSAAYSSKSRRDVDPTFRSAFSSRIRRQAPAPPLVQATSDSPIEDPEDLTSYADAVGAGGAPTSDNGILDVTPSGGSDGSNNSGDSGESIQGAAIPGMGNGQYPGGEAHPGTPGPAGPGTVSNQGTEANNDAESQTHEATLGTQPQIAGEQVPSV